MMFAQRTQKCVNSVLLFALLCCILPPPAQASKVSEQLQMQAPNRPCSATETKMAEKELFLWKFAKIRSAIADVYLSYVEL